MSLFFIRLYKLSQAIRHKLLRRVFFRYRVLAGSEHRQVLTPDLATVLDIGANRGQFSLAVRQWAPNARIIAFEPLSEAAEVFKKVFKGDTRVFLYRAAIGRETGYATIHVSAIDHSSSLLPISQLQQNLFPGTGETRTETIKVSRLAYFVSADDIKIPAMLKIDVQGYEIEVLRGCEALLELFSWVYVECSFVELYKGQALVHEVIEWLAQRSFTLTGLYNIVYDNVGKSIQGDFHFTRTYQESQRR